jgi:CTP synthase (UTP-ammonia lyase)
MSDSLKIAIIGDYNFTYNSHHATNLALDHATDFLEIETNYYWLKPTEVILQKPIYFEQYDGILFAPGPYQNAFYLNGLIRSLAQQKTPCLLTGEAFKGFVEVLIQMYHLHQNGEKLISENLIAGNSFEKISVVPESKEFIQLYDNFSTIELSSSRYSLYPQLISQLTTEIIDIEAWNQFEEPEIIRLKNHSYFMACGFCPQISSTREIPHPIIFTFLKNALKKRNLVS